MRILDKHLLTQLSSELALLHADMLESEASLHKSSLAVHEAHRQSARNLAHYLALRRHDIRQLQSQLALLGLSSLGRTESHVLTAVETVHHVLNALLGGPNGPLPCSEEPALEIAEGMELLEANADALLGPPPPGRKVRIMVTMSSEAATDYDLVRDLVRDGMDCMRINCAHDDPEVWLGMIRNLQKAREETGRNCRILMDVAGPKLRTGLIEPGPSVIKCRPKRDVYGRVVTPARIWLTPNDNPEPAPSPATGCVPLAASSPRNSGRVTESAFEMLAKPIALFAFLRFWAEVVGPRRSKRFISSPDCKSSRSDVQHLGPVAVRKKRKLASVSFRRFRKRCS
jgi:pyruvate kinase